MNAYSKKRTNIEHVKVRVFTEAPKNTRAVHVHRLTKANFRASKKTFNE